MSTTRSLYLTFSEQEFKKLKKAKDLSDLTWEGFILKECVKNGREYD